MADNARIPLAVGLLVGAVSVTLLFQTISLVAVGFVAAGGGLAWFSVRYSADFSSATNAAQLGLGLGFLFGLPVYYVLVTVITTVDLLLTAARGANRSTTAYLRRHRPRSPVTIRPVPTTAHAPTVTRGRTAPAPTNAPRSSSPTRGRLSKRRPVLAQTVAEADDDHVGADRTVGSSAAFATVALAFTSAGRAIEDGFTVGRSSIRTPTSASRSVADSRPSASPTREASIPATRSRAMPPSRGDPRRAYLTVNPTSCRGFHVPG